MVPLSLLPPPAAAEVWSTISGWGREGMDQFKLIKDQGSTELYLSGYDYHGRSAYTQERLVDLNEHTWGIGMGRRLRNTHDDD